MLTFVKTLTTGFLAIKASVVNICLSCRPFHNVVIIHNGA